MKHLEKTILTICPCSPAPRQLIQRGCFALAPLEPTLAVDFKVLDFVSTLFLHVAPNNTGWTDMVETFLAKQGYKLAAEGSLRKQFGNVLVWYNVLQDATTRHVDQVLHIARHLDVEIDDGMDISQEFEEDDPFLSLCGRQSNPPNILGPPPQTPRSPLPSPFQSPQTPLQSPRTPHHRPTVEDDEDDPPIPAAGFKHACDEENTDESSESSNPFPDPWARVRPSDYLRARCPLCFGGEFPRACTDNERLNDDPDTIVCIDACFTQKRNRQAQDPPRTHPRTIFIPEQDVEAMDKYVEFIRAKKAPAKKRTNVEEHDHIEGSLRVPKLVLDGCKASFTAVDSRLSDREGCEHFWHSISRLIAYLQVCGYHQRLYTLDRQVDYAQSKILENMGAWLLRRSRHALAKRKAAEDVLRKCGKSEIDLRAEWKAQVETQISQSRNAGKDAVKELIQLRETRDGLKKRQREYDALIEDENTPVDEYTDAKNELGSVRLRLQELTAKIWGKQSALGVTDRARLEKLLNDPFLTARMNALALKQRLRDRLRTRKFELDWLERSFRKQVNDQKVDAHTAASVKSRKPAISKLACSYNALCDTMQQLFNKGKVPRGAICPKQLELKGIFDLDVDDTIWEDIGLEEGTPAAPPPWLADENVRAGIKALLKQDRCLEEELSVHSLDFGDITSLPDWGPSAEDILNFRNVQKTVLVKDIPRTYTDNTKHDNQLHCEERDEESEYSDSEHGEVDMFLIDTIDAVHLADTARSEMVDNDKYLYDE
ncbi:hypothetical protein DXG01_006992 [Tephrocybe rancida]|nr:hypothetical protein DXG01_006992 [Tephrocybe rancida]